MSAIFSYRDEVLYSHHTVDLSPDRESFSMHAHEWMEIYYCISGQGTHFPNRSKLVKSCLIVRQATS